MSTTPRTIGEDGSQQAAEFMSRVISTIAAQDKAAGGGAGLRLFFPEGIDVISLKFKVGNAADISLTISGKACCKSTADSDETAGDVLDATAQSSLHEEGLA